MILACKNRFLNPARCFAIVLLIGLLVVNPLASIACATCGCSELCPLTMMENSETSNSKLSLSDSIWGNIILKMAYQRDPELQKLRGHVRGVNDVTAGAVSTAVGGTLAQNIVSMACLNPPAGISDSYLPGSIGLGLSGLINIFFDGNILVNWRLKSKIKARQIAIREHVEAILTHLEFSETNCPQAQSDLSEIIGQRAATDCIQLWRSSHATASVMKNKTLSQGKRDDNIGESIAPSLAVISNAGVQGSPSQ